MILKHFLPAIALLIAIFFDPICSNEQQKKQKHFDDKTWNKILFPGYKLPRHFTFKFDVPFEEFFIPVAENKMMSALLFKADSSKGLIFYLHGNKHALDECGKIAGVYTKLKYDVFMLDYRGYGKSQGSIESEDQLTAM